MKSILFLLFISFFEIFADRPMIILVHPFKNNGDAKYSWVSAGLSESVTHDLRNLDGVTIISQEDRRRALQELKYKQMVGESEEGVEVANLMGADVIFTGSYSIVDEETRVMAKITKANDGSLQKSIKLDGKFSEIHSLQDQIVIGLLKESESIKIANVIPKVLTREETQKYQERPKPKFSAFELYSKGAELQESNPQQAFVFMRQALDVDPNYVNALLGIAGILEHMNKQWESSEYYLRASPLLEKQGLHAQAVYYKSGALFKRNQNKEGYFLLNEYIKSIKLGNLKELSSENQTREFRFQYLIFYNLGGYLIREKKYQEANRHLQIARKILDLEGMRKTYYYMDVLNALILSEMADFNEEKRYFTEERKQTILSLGNDYYELLANLGFKFDSVYATSFDSLGEIYCDYLDESFPLLLFKFLTFQKSNRYKGALFYKNALIIHIIISKRIEYLKLAKKISDEKKEKGLSEIISDSLVNDNILKRLKENQRSTIFFSALLVVIPFLFFILVLWGNSLIGEYELWKYLSFFIKFTSILLFIYSSYQLTNNLFTYFY
jgi:TolB-like protein